MMKTMSIKQCAQLLGIRPKQLYCTLRHWELTTKANLPSDKMLRLGYMRIQHTPYLDNEGRERYSNTARITQAGASYIYERLRTTSPELITTSHRFAANDPTQTSLNQGNRA